MENNATSSIEMLIQKAEDYGKTTVTLLKLNAVDKASGLVSGIAIKLTLFLVVALFLFTFSVGLALWIGEQQGKTYFGFFTVTGIYVLIGLFLYIFRFKLIGTPIRNAVIIEMLKKD